MIIESMPFGEYLDLPRASSSSLHALLTKSPMAMIYAKAHPTETTPLTAGKLTHLLILQPELESAIVRALPEDAEMVSNAGKRSMLAFLESCTCKNSTAGADLAEGKMLSARIAELRPLLDDTDLIVCSQADYDSAQWMRDNVMQRSLGRAIFEQGRAELTVLGADEETGVEIKTRPDWESTNLCLLTDLKTSRHVSRSAFSRDVANYGYHLQAALYRRVYEAATGVRAGFLHLVVQNEAPHDVAFFEMDDVALSTGAAMVDQALRMWRDCQESDTWPGVGWDYDLNEYQVQTLSLPKWATILE